MVVQENAPPSAYKEQRFKTAAELQAEKLER